MEHAGTLIVHYLRIALGENYRPDHEEELQKIAEAFANLDKAQVATAQALVLLGSRGP